MRCRHQWFQTQNVVEVAVLAKDMTKERVDIHIDKQHLHVLIRDAEGEQEYELDLELYGEVSSHSLHPYLKAMAIMLNTCYCHSTALCIAMGTCPDSLYLPRLEISSTFAIIW